jgi:hypothetical protein
MTISARRAHHINGARRRYADIMICGKVLIPSW